MSGLRQILGSRFGHFAAASPALAAKPPEDEDEAKRAAAAKAEEDEKEAARKKAEDDEEEARRARRARRARKGRHAKGDDEDDAADDDEDEEDEEEMKKAAAAGHGFALEAAFRAGARAQRRRCAAIFDAKAAAANPALAASFAFETPLTAAAAVALLEKTPMPAKSALAERMLMSGAAQLRVGPGSADAPQGQAAIAASWDHALKGLGAATHLPQVVQR